MLCVSVSYLVFVVVFQGRDVVLVSSLMLQLLLSGIGFMLSQAIDPKQKKKKDNFTWECKEVSQTPNMLVFKMNRKKIKPQYTK